MNTIESLEIPNTSTDTIENSQEWLDILGEHENTTQFDELKKNQDLIHTLQQENLKLTSTLSASQKQYLDVYYQLQTANNMLSQIKKSKDSETIKKTFPPVLALINQLKMILEQMESDLASHPMIVGIQLVITKALAGLQDVGIYQIISLGELPDAEYHEVMMIDDPLTLTEKERTMIETISQISKSDISGHIIRELEVGYYQSNGEVRTVIQPSKVVVAS